MFKRIVGAVAVLTVTVGALGMGYPQENENQAEDATVVDTTAATVDMVENLETTQADAEAVQEQGTESISEVADTQAVIQDSPTPLVEAVVESNKRKMTLTDEELQLLLRVVSAEARGESQEAQYTVACVIFNRMESTMFPNTLTEVVMQNGQFSCVANGAIYNVPITESVAQAVVMAMDDNTLDPSIMWFRSSYYHSFRTQSFQIGKLFFSQV